jgi:signal transduction histidine kinase
LLAFARELQCADDFRELMAMTRAELPTSLGCHHAWLFVAERDDPGELRLLDSAGARRDLRRELVPRLRIAGDAMLEEIAHGISPVVIVDARVDPRTNKEIVARLESRTIISMPLRLQDQTLAVFGTGTFGDEGCRPPTVAQLDYLIGMGVQIRVAADRIRFLEERKRGELAMVRLENQLRQAQKMEAVGRLAGGIAHDFNNLLSVILSYTDLALADLDPASACHADLEEVMKAGRRASELTRKLLSFSHQHAIAPRICDLSEVVTGMDGMLRRLIGENIEFETVPQEALARVQADPGVIEQVVMNLVVNARDAMPDGGKLLVETSDVVLDEAYAKEHVGVVAGPHVMLAVSDTGCGMDKDTQERMFEPFFTTKEQGKGTGIGLCTVYGLVKQSGGTVSVYSEPGNGTTIRTYIPTTTAREKPALVIAPAVFDVSGSETILLVEDDQQFACGRAQDPRGAGVSRARGQGSRPRGAARRAAPGADRLAAHRCGHAGPQRRRARRPLRIAAGDDRGAVHVRVHGDVDDPPPWARARAGAAGQADHARHAAGAGQAGARPGEARPERGRGRRLSAGRRFTRS